MAEPTAAKTAAPRLMLLALKQPAIALSALYLITAVIGMAVAYFKYQAYGLLIFEWWEPSDYFLAAFREPGTFALTLWSAILALVLRWAYRRFVARDAAQRTSAEQPRAGRWWNRNAFADRVNNLSPQGRTWILVGTAFAWFLIAASSGGFQHYEDIPKIHVRFADGRMLPSAPGEECYLLGTANQFLFVGTTRLGGTVSVLPLNNIAAIERITER